MSSQSDDRVTADARTPEQTIREAFEYAIGNDVAGWDADIPTWEVGEIFDGAVDALARDLAAARTELATTRAENTRVLNLAVEENNKLIREMLRVEAAKAERDAAREEARQIRLRLDECLAREGDRP